MGGLWWTDDDLSSVNALFNAVDDTSCIARMFVFSGNETQPCQVLVPAPFEYDIAQDSVYALRKSDVLSEPWESRWPQVYYRGADSLPTSCRKFLPLGSNPRLILENLSKSHHTLVDAALGRDKTKISDFARYRYLVDIGGQSCTSSSSLHWKLATGSLVFVVTLPGNHSIWWMRHELQPYVHYVPIKPDLSNLLDNVEYYEANVGEATGIAARGQRAAMRYTQGRAYDILGKILLDAVQAASVSASVLVPYAGSPITSLWYCAVGRGSACDVNLDPA
ncbi:hypothetical protein CTAYLR_003614 [Chrysophaeum taylorii]|uniref:Glycosyl transferase CAP10 domain-containing protein n=1 Tax=Chrysophaeum taylorii TaxID=2483200 RepID=A0AAD7XJZ5_9STRA|nr:hypothetical protein CTAYLR_003614 [Chrysophaeum taylorii]